MIRIALLLAFLFAAPFPAAAQADRAADMLKNGHVGNCASCHGRKNENRYSFDTERTRVLFSVGNHGFGQTVGVISDVEGGFLFDPKAVEKSSVLASIRTDSLDTADPLVNAVLLSERFFDADRHRFISFASTRVERTGDRTGKLFGALTIRGTTRPVVLDVAFNKAARHPATGAFLAGFTASGAFRRSDFDMTVGLPAIGDEVALTIEVVGKKLE